MHQIKYLHAALWVGVVLIIGVLTGCGGGASNTPATTATTTSIPGLSMSPPTAITDKGTVTGFNTPIMHEFLGIPYATPPVGSLRWQAPQPADAWSSPREATSFTSPCAQPDVASSSEDCLYLNVYVPNGNGPFPVMVWIHGGGLTSGDSSSYDPAALVSSSVIVVSINYRLGVLGFLAHPALTAANGSSGNYGLMDQQAALRWIKTNIAAFGGNPNNVTLFGESAGGLSTHSQIVSPLAAGLFQKAIVESGSYAISLPTLEETETLGQGFATAAGCDSQTVACMQALPVSTILANATAILSNGSVLPTVDGVLLPMSIGDALSAGKFNKVPMIEGTNQHEWSFQSSTSIDVELGHPLNASDYPTFINADFGSFGPTVQAAYPLTSAHTPAWTYDSVLTDVAYSCTGRAVAQQVAAYGVNVYAYEFADANAPVVVNFPPRIDGFGAYHTSELQYIFPSTNFTIYYGSPFTPAQTALSNQMVGFWSQFAKIGNPNAAGNTWPAYTVANDTYLTLAPNAVVPTTSFAADHSCSFWGFQ